MRIVAGTHKGRRLLGPADKATTRPITDRVKTALFDRLDAAGRLAGAVVVDLFAGTGSLGLEALSRGADHVTLIERDPGARARLTRNVQALGAGREVNVVAGDALSGSILAALRRPPTLIFLDPPYRMMTRETDAARVRRQAERLAEAADGGALLILRTDKHVPAPPLAGWAEPASRTYGSMVVHAYPRQANR